MTTYARRFASVPERTASETWRAIVSCLDPPPAARKVLEASTSALAIVIAEEIPASLPIVLSGCGPQVRIYAVFGQDSIDGHNVNERPVTGLDFGSDWQMRVPTGDDAEVIGALVDGVHVVVSPGGAAIDECTCQKEISTFDLSALESP